MGDGETTMNGALRRTLNLARPDDIDDAIVDAREGLSDGRREAAA